MSRARPFLVIAGALALFPAGFAAARIVVTAIVVPILCMVSDIGYRLPQTAGVPEPRLRLAGQYDLGSADAGADRHWYYLDTAREESPSSVCSLHNQARMVAAYTNGMLSGYRLTAIQPGSVWRRISSSPATPSRFRAPMRFGRERIAGGHDCEATPVHSAVRGNAFHSHP